MSERHDPLLESARASRQKIVDGGLAGIVRRAMIDWLTLLAVVFVVGLLTGSGLSWIAELSPMAFVILVTASGFAIPISVWKDLRIIGQSPNSGADAGRMIASLSALPRVLAFAVLLAIAVTLPVAAIMLYEGETLGILIVLGGNIAWSMVLMFVLSRVILGGVVLGRMQRSEAGGA